MAHITEVRTATGTRYDVRWRMPNGRQRQKRFLSKREAQRWMKSMSGAPVDTLAGRTMFAVVAKQALAAKPLKPSTLAGYERIVSERLLPTFGGMRIDKVTRADIVAWQASLPKRSTNTTRNWFMALSKVLRFALRQGLITSNPMDAIDKPVLLVGGVARFLNATEVEKLALAFNDDVFAMLVRFAAWTGLRAGELTALTVGDVNLSRGIVSVTKTVRRRAGEWEVTSPKSQRSTRDVPLAPHVVTWLRA